MKIQEFIKKLREALEDEDTAKALESFGIIPEQMDEFKDLIILDSPDLDKALEIKTIQSTYDKRLGQAAETARKNAIKKYGLGEEEDKEKDEEEETDVKDPAMKAVLAQMKKMGERLESFEAEKAKETLEQRKTRATEYLKSKNLPKVYLHEMDLDKEFEEQFDALSEKAKEDGFVTKPQAQPGARTPVPRRGDDDNKPSKAEVEAFKQKM